MPSDLLTLADVIADAQDLSDIEVTDLEQSAPLVARLSPEEASDGTTHKYVKEVGAPVVGFREINAGRDLDHSVDVAVSADLAYLDYSWEVDTALADRRRGRNRGPEWLIAREGNRHRNAALFKYEQQLIYGQAAGDADGFAGLLDQATLDHTDSAMVVDATGSSANLGSSVYAMRIGPSDVAAVYNGDTPIQLGETNKQQVADANGKKYYAYCTDGGMWLGLQVGAAKSIGRLCNLTAQADKGLSDKLVAKLLELFPASRMPNVLAMSRRSLWQLQASRTATTQTGAPAPVPADVFGIPVLVLDSIRDNEPIVTAA